MTTKSKTPRTAAKRTRRKSVSEDRGEIVSLNVYSSQDPRKGSTKEAFLGEIPDSETYRVEAARTFGGDRNYLFVPRYTDGTYGASFAQYCPEVIEEVSEEMLIEAEADDDPPAADVEKIIDRRLDQRLAMMRQANPSTPQQGTTITELVLALKQLDELRGRTDPQPKDGAADFVGQLRAMEEVRRMFAPKEANLRPIQPEHKPTALEALITLASEEPATLAAIRSRFLGSEGEESGLLQMLPIIAPFAERAIHSISSAIAAYARPSASPTVQGDGQNIPQPQTPNASSGTQPQDEVATLAYQRLIARVLSAMAMNTDVDAVIGALDGFCNLFPEHAATIGNLMSAPAENVLQLINQTVPDAEQVTAAPHALDWMRTLQTAFSNGYEQEDFGEDGVDGGQSIGPDRKNSTAANSDQTIGK